MADKSISWPSWGWITVLALMLIVPIAGIVFDRAVTFGNQLIPVSVGIVFGFALALSALHFRQYRFWWPAALALFALMIVLYHRSIGLLLLGEGIGAFLTLFRKTLLKIANRVIQRLIDDPDSEKL